MQPWLVARWEDVLVARWRVPDDVVRPYVPPGLRLDRTDGRAVACVVSATIRSPSFLGISVPGASAVPLLALVFTVRDAHRRGVGLIGAHVGNTPLAALVRWGWRAPVKSARGAAGSAARTLVVGGGEQRVTWCAEGERVHPGRDSADHLLLERRFAFLGRGGGTAMVRMERPPWRVYERVEATLELDHAALWGPQWGFLAETPPDGTLLAEGSELAFYPRRAWDGGADERRVPEARLT